jgi:hypothetical protein
LLMAPSAGVLHRRRRLYEHSRGGSHRRSTRPVRCTSVSVSIVRVPCARRLSRKCQGNGAYQVRCRRHARWCRFVLRRCAQVPSGPSLRQQERPDRTCKHCWPDRGQGTVLVLRSAFTMCIRGRHCRNGSRSNTGETIRGSARRGAHLRGTSRAMSSRSTTRYELTIRLLDSRPGR